MAPSVDPEGGAVRPGRRLRVGVAITVVLMVAGGVVGVHRLWALTDPFPVGSSRRVDVRADRCGRPDDVHLGDRTWSAAGPTPASWSSAVGRLRSVAGTFTVVDVDQGVFTADDGGSVRYERLPADVLGGDPCFSGL